MGHKRSPLQKVSQKFCGQPKSQPPRYQYLDWSKASRKPPHGPDEVSSSRDDPDPTLSDDLEAAVGALPALPAVTIQARRLTPAGFPP
jgi:hypothetical protein